MWLILSTLLIQLTLGEALYPRASESRDVISLDGLWSFSLTSSISQEFNADSETYVEHRQLTNPIKMPVPASYNDITVDKDLRDHAGVVWYERTFFVPSSWSEDQRVWIRFGSVCYSAQVFVNDMLVIEHSIGHLPFQQDITSVLNFGEENTITVAVDNTLSNVTIPQGGISEIRSGNLTITQLSYSFDFFSYAGIDRSVYLYSTPITYISDISINTTSANAKAANLSYRVDVSGNEGGSPVSCSVILIDKDGAVITTGDSCVGNLTVNSPRLWWPYLMDPNPGYLYTLQVEIFSGDSHDIYRQKVGIRTVSWDTNNVFINGKPIYIRGFGRHEDSAIRGKGFDWPLVIKDHNLIKWIGANAYRTSHYPYAEEIMDIADSEGIIIIDECPGVNIENFSSELSDNHKRSLTELINRDKNRPSVIFWSIANEPRSGNEGAGDYFKEIARHTKALDPSRPITLAMSEAYDKDQAGEFLDVVSFNRYNAWYSDAGLIPVITNGVIEEAQNWRNKHNKPILMTEYGADTIPGLHSVPDYIFSEEFQESMMERHFIAFDNLRNQGWFIGEMIWNFADFMTVQTITRVYGNRKGVFTRDRQPKAGAHTLRQRYWSLGAELDGVNIPEGVFPQINSNKKIK